MNVGVRPKDSPVNVKPENLVYVMEPPDDEINLGEFFQNLLAEWKTILLVMIAGLLLSLFAAFVLTRAHLVESVVRAPTVNELADVNNQSLLNISPGIALGKFVDELLSYELQIAVFEQSDLYRHLSEDSSLDSSQIFSDIQADLAVNRVQHDYYELDKEEKTPFKEIRISLPSSNPELAAGYIDALIGSAKSNTVSQLSRDITEIKNYKIKAIRDQLDSLSAAANAGRIAQIRRLQESNEEKIAGLQMQIDLAIENARIKRENAIIRVEEALKTAKKLNIVDPVTWDDLRTSRIASQITNEFGGADKTIPHYFQGTRILTAELDKLKSREDDRPFISIIPDLEQQIKALENDPKIAALEARQNDTIYIEKFDELQRSLSQLIAEPTQFNNTQLAVVSQKPLVSPKPVRNPLLVIIVGLFLSGILALFIGMLMVSFRKRRLSAVT